MNEYLMVILFIFFVMFICYLNRPYFIDKSNINGLGLYSNRNYKKNDVIIEDLFAYNTKRNVIKYLSTKEFNDYILNEGKYINHCTTKYNTDLITNDNIYFKLIAIEDIPKNKEIVANYDKINNKFPFIDNSKEYYKKC